MMNYRRLTIFLPDEIIKTIKKMAIDCGMPTSRYIEDLIEEEVKRKEEKTAKQFADTTPTVSQPVQQDQTNPQAGVTVTEPVINK